MADNVSEDITDEETIALWGTFFDESSAVKMSGDSLIRFFDMLPKPGSIQTDGDLESEDWESLVLGQFDYGLSDGNTD